VLHLSNTEVQPVSDRRTSLDTLRPGDADLAQGNAAAHPQGSSRSSDG
jgi:hypothetical protein